MSPPSKFRRRNSLVATQPSKRLRTAAAAVALTSPTPVARDAGDVGNGKIRSSSISLTALVPAITLERVTRSSEKATIHAKRMAQSNPTSPVDPQNSSTSKEHVSSWSPNRAKGKLIPMSHAASRTHNPIRHIVDSMKVAPNPNKSVIMLSLGDPTVHGAFEPSDVMAKAIKSAIDKGGADVNGYLPSIGRLDARESISRLHPGSRASDVIVTSGCSHALELAITGMLNEGDVLMVPQPGFPLYGTIAKARNVQVRGYRLNPDTGWQIDLEDLEAKVDAKCKVIVVNNPSNPCGSVFSESHLRDVIAFAERHGLIILADEIYGDMTFSGVSFHPIASLSRKVPVVTVSGLAKQYLVPGWRLGWLVTHDPSGVMSNVHQGFIQLSTLILGASSVIQAAVPEILNSVTPTFKRSVTHKIHQNAQIVMSTLCHSPAFTVIPPQGAMYVMVRINFGFLTLRTEVEFSEKLMAEQSVMVLPGSCFGAEGFVRLVLTPSKDRLLEACERMVQFSAKYGGRTRI